MEKDASCPDLEQIWIGLDGSHPLARVPVLLLRARGLRLASVCALALAACCAPHSNSSIFLCRTASPFSLL